jgi:NAD(P)H-hydrate epimerase
VLRARGILVADAEQDQRSRVLRLQVGKARFILDAVLGTGSRLPLHGAAQEVLRVVQHALAERERPPIVVAVDCPSGLDCDTGSIASEALPADLTVTLAAAKLGLLRFPGAAYVGRLVIGKIGLPEPDPILAAIPIELADPEQVRSFVPRRPKDSHKGTFGRVLVVAGSSRYPGAALLAARSAYLAGAGLVCVAAPGSVQPAIAGALPEATWLPLPDQRGAIGPAALEMLLPEWGGYEAVLFGPGVGAASGTAEFVASLFGPSGPAATRGSDAGGPAWVIDADGLRHVGRLETWAARLPEDTILTPHPGEMSQLIGLPIGTIQSDRLGTALRAAQDWRQVIVLKGAHTVIAEPSGKATILPFATPALARAGTGDVLAGVIAGLRTQGVPAYPAAILGGYLHGRAGELASESVGTAASVLAGDVAKAIPRALAELEQA